jgi:hypothetical protein
MIGWKAIKKGRVMRGGKGIGAYDSSMENAYPLISGETFSLAHIEAGSPIPDRDLEGTFIDTGENGVFSLEEFKAITSLGLMEFVTPEEVADLVMLNIKGAPNSKDMMSAIDASVLGSTYRAGLLRDCAVRQMEGLGEDGISYGFLGPRLSKLVFEARLLKDCFTHVENVLARQPSDISRILEARVLEDNILRTMAISIGIPFLLSDGQRLAFAHRAMQDKEWEEKPWVVSSDSIDRFASREWIDLRPANIVKWQVRFSRILEEMKASFHEESSCFDRGRGFWKKDQEGRTLIDAGEVAAWVLIQDYGGGRR